MQMIQLVLLLEYLAFFLSLFFFSSRRRHTRCSRDWSSDVCSSDLAPEGYLPSFLNFKFPYAQEEDALVVMYKYYSGGTNVRGNLLPLLDLKGFVTGQDVASKKGGRVLVAKHDDGVIGLIVDEILGLKHFYLEEQAFEIPALADSFRPYINMAFKNADQHWPVFSFKKLVQQERFLQIAI